MEQYRLMGYPLGHSLSPEIHARLFALTRRDAAYALWEFPPQTLAAQIPGLEPLSGCNVTIPYKQAVIPHLHQLSASAALYGAVNTISSVNGCFTGHNTDCDGFLQTMKAHRIALGTTVCILGAGGVGRMFAIECARQGATVTLAVREGSLDKAAALGAEVLEKTGSFVELRDIAHLSGKYGLLINATPVGMYPHVQDSPVSAAFLAGVDAVFDCIYNPTETCLLRDARKLGKKTAGGMDMLVWQAAAAHTIWYGGVFDPQQVLEISREMSVYLLKKERSK